MTPEKQADPNREPQIMAEATSVLFGLLMLALAFLVLVGIGKLVKNNATRGTYPHSAMEKAQ